MSGSLDLVLELIEDNTLPVFLWTFGAVATVATFGRVCIRWRRLRPEMDDLFNVLALVSLIACFATYEEMQTSVDLVPSLKYQMATDMFLWTTLYLVKATFLALIGSIFKVSTKFRRAWWAVSVYTFLSFWPVVLSELWQCGEPSNYANPQDCSPSVTDNLSLIIAGFRLPLHISSDCFILALPLAQIKALQMSTLKKISVGAVFALVIIDIIGAILKQSAVLCALEMDDEYLVCGDMATIWTIVEPAIAVVVCALPAYRALLPSSRKRRGQEMLQQPHAANKAAKALKLNPIPDFDKEMNLLREPELAQLVQLHHSQEDQNRSPQSQASYSDLMV